MVQLMNKKLMYKKIYRWRLAQYDFFKDPIYFRITPMCYMLCDILK